MTFTDKSDSIGALASGLCLIHCIATPLIFVVQPLTVSDQAAPFWWQSLDYIFLLISFFAVFWTVRNTSKTWIKYALWVSYVLLVFAIMNEKFELFHLGELVEYLPAASLIGLHLYNRKYCQCAPNDSCCAA